MRLLIGWRAQVNSTSRDALFASSDVRGGINGPYAGLVFFQERGSRADCSILKSDSSSIIEGILYFPPTPLHLSGKGRISSASPWTGIMVDKLELNLNSVMNIRTDYAAS